MYLYIHRTTNEETSEHINRYLLFMFIYPYRSMYLFSFYLFIYHFCRVGLLFGSACPTRSRSVWTHGARLRVRWQRLDTLSLRAIISSKAKTSDHDISSLSIASVPASCGHASSKPSSTFQALYLVAWLRLVSLQPRQGRVELTDPAYFAGRPFLIRALLFSTRGGLCPSVPRS